MNRARRRLVSFLMAIFLVNMLTWSFSSEALADWITEEQATAVSNAASASANDPVDSHKSEQTCNHGCHAASHFQVQVSIPLAFLSPRAALPFLLDESFSLPLGIAQRQFRPPRQTFQA